MPEMSIDFSVYCSCGEGLCYQTAVNGNVVTIDPCQKCLSRTKEESHQEGYDEGYSDGRDSVFDRK
jgi:hypothetical protein